jgi:transcriptional regulator with XRE-family HTH domain
MAGVGRDAAARVPVRTPEQLRMMAMAGDSLRDVRQVAGLTASDIARALDLRDKSVWEAVEDGREVLSMELILRLASLLARNDPLPFVLRMARSYQPRLWAVLEELGVDALPLQLERERDFINIFRRHDAARALPDADWARLLAFTRQAFEMGLGLMENDPNTATGESSPAPAEARRRKRRSPK